MLERLELKYWAAALAGLALLVVLIGGVMAAVGWMLHAADPGFGRTSYVEAPVGPVIPPAPELNDKGEAVTRPIWVRQPTPTYPVAPAAERAGQGEVVLNCASQPNGSLSDCRIVSETPKGAGFAQSAMEAATRARLAPATVNGEAAQRRVTFTTRYRLK